MTTCLCGVDIQWTTHAQTGERIPIETSITELDGPDRYVVVDTDDASWVVKPLEPLAHASGHPDHRPRCGRRQDSRRTR